jgi:DinB superfamily
MALDRMEGLDDDEYFWEPSPGAATVAWKGGGLRPVPALDDRPRTRTIALLAGHLGEMAFLRADYVDGEHRLTRADIDWPDTAVGGLAFISAGWSRWREAVSGLRESELDIVGRCDFPGGLDLQLPVVDIVWWMNRELIHHTAEMAFVRDLYATR